MISDIRLRYLFESARLETMRAAADKLDVATSSVSRQIAELEKELGIALIEKSRRRIKLTEAGEAAYLYYRDKLSQEEAFQSKIEELKNMRTGNIYLAMGSAFISQQFSEMLQGYLEQYPNINIHILTDTTASLLQKVRDDEAHIGLVFAMPRDPKIRAKLTLKQPLKVIVPSDHKLSRKKTLKLTDLVNEKIGLPEEGFRIRQIIRSAEQEEGVFLNASMTTNSLDLLCDFVASGRGISILPELVVQRGLMSGELKAVPTNNKQFNATESVLITRIGRQLPIAAHHFSIKIESYLKNTIKALDSSR
jgi:DNA-binding transcriptional LysR family regulator